MKPVWIRMLVAALIVAGCNSTEPAASPGAAVNGQGLPAGGAVEAAAHGTHPGVGPTQIHYRKVSEYVERIGTLVTILNL